MVRILTLIFMSRINGIANRRERERWTRSDLYWLYMYTWWKMRAIRPRILTTLSGSMDFSTPWKDRSDTMGMPAALNKSTRPPFVSPFVRLCPPNEFGLAKGQHYQHFFFSSVQATIRLFSYCVLFSCTNRFPSTWLFADCGGVRVCRIVTYNTLCAYTHWPCVLESTRLIHQGPFWLFSLSVERQYVKCELERTERAVYALSSQFGLAQLTQCGHYGKRWTRRLFIPNEKPQWKSAFESADRAKQTPFRHPLSYSSVHIYVDLLKRPTGRMESMGRIGIKGVNNSTHSFPQSPQYVSRPFRRRASLWRCPISSLRHYWLSS